MGESSCLLHHTELLAPLNLAVVLIWPPSNADEILVLLCVMNSFLKVKRKCGQGVFFSLLPVAEKKAFCRPCVSECVAPQRAKNLRRTNFAQKLKNNSQVLRAHIYLC